MIALAVMVFAQISIAAAGCLSSRTASVAEQPAGEDCPIATLLCRAHCQAQEQTLDPVQIPVLGAEELTPVLNPVARNALPLSLSRPSLRLAPPAATPPPIILFARLLI